jgi:hypothetical protein
VCAALRRPFPLATTFDACDTGGLTISGDLDYASSIVVTADTATTELTMKGSLSDEGQGDGRVRRAGHSLGLPS